MTNTQQGLQRRMNKWLHNKKPDSLTLVIALFTLGTLVTATVQAIN